MYYTGDMVGGGCLAFRLGRSLVTYLTRLIGEHFTGDAYVKQTIYRQFIIILELN